MSVFTGFIFQKWNAFGRYFFVFISIKVLHIVIIVVQYSCKEMEVIIMLKSNVMKKVNALAKAICSACGGDYRIALHFAFKYAYSKKGSHNFGLRQAIYRLAGFCGMPYWFAEEKDLFEMMNNFVSYKRAHETEKAVLLDIAYNALVSEGWDYKTKTLHEKVWVPKSIMVA